MSQEFIDALQEQPKVDFIKSLFTVMMVTAGKGLSQEDFTTILKDKLTLIEGSHFKGSHPDEAALITAHPTAESGSYAYVIVNNTEHHFIWDDGNSSWLDSGAASAVHLTDAQIKTQYENNTDTNVFDDAAKTLLISALQTHQDISGKVDTETGKGLSEENFTTTLLGLINSALQTHQDISGKVDTEAGKGLSSNDYTDGEKLKLSTLDGSHFKGSHPDEAALLLAHPTAEAGSYAYVLVHNTEHHFIWDGAAWLDTGAAGPVHLTDAQIKSQYENNADTECFTPTEQTKLGNIPAPPTPDGEYVLTVVGGVSTWGLNSGGALIYDAYLLGSSVNADVAMSIYHKFDGQTEETRNAAIDLTDGQEYLVQPMYQSGLTDAHILDGVNMFASKSFADQAQATPTPNQLYGDSGNPILGQALKAWVNAGATIAIKYDSVFGGLKATIRP